MAEQSTIPALWKVPLELRDRVGKQAGRQRAMPAEGHLLLILHRPPKPEETKRGGRFFWRKPDGLWDSSHLGGGPQALARHLDEYAAMLNEYDEQAEAAVSAEDHFEMLNALAPLHRAARHMHQALQDARKMLPQDRDLIVFRDRAYEIERTAELLYSEARNALDFAIARRGEEQARSSYRMAISSHRLNLLAALFFPIATLGALFGVNMAHGLESLYEPVPFLCVLGFGLAAGLLLAAFISADPFRRPKEKSRREQPSGHASRQRDPAGKFRSQTDRQVNRR